VPLTGLRSKAATLELPSGVQVVVWVLELREIQLMGDGEMHWLKLDVTSRQTCSSKLRAPRVQVMDQRRGARPRRNYMKL
jgi:hypothetical protein